MLLAGEDRYLGVLVCCPRRGCAVMPAAPDSMITISWPLRVLLVQD